MSEFSTSSDAGYAKKKRNEPITMEWIALNSYPDPEFPMCLRWKGARASWCGRPKMSVTITTPTGSLQRSKRIAKIVCEMRAGMSYLHGEELLEYPQGKNGPRFVVHHRCDHIWCVNPDHVWWDTDKKNLEHRRNREFIHRNPRRGRLLTEEEVLAIYWSDIPIEPACSVFGVCEHTILTIRGGRHRFTRHLGHRIVGRRDRKDRSSDTDEGQAA